MSKITIAVDGHSSCGKSSIAKALAKRLNYIYIDTGAMYRAVTLFALRNGLFESGELNKSELLGRLDDIKIGFEHNNATERSEILLNGQNVEDQIRGMEVSSKVSIIAAIPEVREKMVALQRSMGRNKGVAMDGRDIGSVVFPDAELKLFVTARDEVRAQRRKDELEAKGQQVKLEEILANIRERDHIDSTRASSPLIQTKDAVVVDNSDMSIEEQNDLVLELAKERGA